MVLPPATSLGARGDDYHVREDRVRVRPEQDGQRAEGPWELEGPRGKAARILLYLFERDAAVRYLRCA